jgi:hypothetical protein
MSSRRLFAHRQRLPAGGHRAHDRGPRRAGPRCGTRTPQGLAAQLPPRSRSAPTVNALVGRATCPTFAWPELTCSWWLRQAPEHPCALTSKRRTTPCSSHPRLRRRAASATVLGLAAGAWLELAARVAAECERRPSRTSWAWSKHVAVSLRPGCQLRLCSPHMSARTSRRAACDWGRCSGPRVQGRRLVLAWPHRGRPAPARPVPGSGCHRRVRRHQLGGPLTAVLTLGLAVVAARPIY